jgi:hypothetical protein
MLLTKYDLKGSRFSFLEPTGEKFPCLRSHPYMGFLGHWESPTFKSFHLQVQHSFSEQPVGPSKKTSKMLLFH